MKKLKENQKNFQKIGANEEKARGKHEIQEKNQDEQQQINLKENKEKLHKRKRNLKGKQGRESQWEENQ